MAVVKILIVTDAEGGFVRSNAVASGFHIGEFVQVLHDTAWDGFTIEIVKAHRWPAFSGSGADKHDFRFTAATLAGFDMAFFISIATVSEENAFTNDAQRRDEASAIAAFMEAGKGFFALGDHEDLGGGINMHVPRVRSMRRWIKAGGPNPRGAPIAPSGTGADRHDTLRAGTDVGVLNGTTYPYQFNDQSDGIAQTIRVTRYTVTRSRWFRSSLPHPLLCSPLGTIDVLPDHMHEGWCEVPAKLDVDEDLPGRAGKPEYPLLGGAPLAPEIVAAGTIEPHVTLNQEFSGSFAISPMTTRTTPFGQIAAYDGHRVGIGRVVCDSTWHHLININLIGTTFSFPGLNPAKAKGFYSGPGDTAVPAYEKIKHYYRNVVYWLIPASRRRWIFADVLATAVMHHPRYEEVRGHIFEKPDLDGIIRTAQLAEHYFAATRGHCFLFQLLPIIFYPIWKPDLHIWENWRSQIDPWDPRIEPGREAPDGGWQSGLQPDARLPWLVAVGTAAVAAVRTRAALGEMTDRKAEKMLAETVALTARMLPENLQLLAKEALSHRRGVEELAQVASEAAEATRTAEPAQVG